MASPLLRFEWYAESLKETYGDRIPDVLTQDIEADVAAIAALNFEGGEVYSTYTSEGLLKMFQLIQADNIYIIAPRAP